MRKLIRFLVVGGVCTGIQYAILIGLVEAMAWQATAASTTGFFVSAAVNYVLNKSLTFRSRVGNRRGMTRFMVVSGTGLALNAGILQASMSLAHFPYVLGQIVATIVVLSWNYLGHLMWTFKSDPKP